MFIQGMQLRRLGQQRGFSKVMCLNAGVTVEQLRAQLDQIMKAEE